MPGLGAKVIRPYGSRCLSIMRRIGVGMAGNTLIVLASEQGFYLGEYGFFDKRFIYEESLKMPFIVRYPKRVKGGSENRNIVSNVDFAPTLLDLAGLKPSAEVEGRSFAAALDNKSPAKWRQSAYYHYYEYPFWHHVQPHYGIRTQDFTLAHFYYDIDVWELYDLKKDPKQMNNVIDDPAYATVVADQKAELKELQGHYRDSASMETWREITETDFGALMKADSVVGDIEKTLGRE